MANRINTCVQRTKNEKRSQIVQKCIYDMKFADDPKIQRPVWYTIRILKKLLDMHAWVTLLPGCTARNLHQINVGCMKFSKYEEIKFEKMIERFFILFWTVFELIWSWRKYQHLKTCDVRYFNHMGNRKRGALHTTYIWCGIYSVQWVSHHRVIISEFQYYRRRYNSRNAILCYTVHP